MMDWIRGRRRNEEPKAENSINKESFYLLVVKEFSVSDDQIDFKTIKNNQDAIGDQVKDRVSNLKEKMERMDDKLDDRINRLKGSLSAKIDENNAKLDEKIASLNDKIEKMSKDMVSEILTALGKQPASSEKSEGQKSAE